jgi:hypothetical protein
MPSITERNPLKLQPSWPLSRCGRTNSVHIFADRTIIEHREGEANAGRRGHYI